MSDACNLSPVPSCPMVLNGRLEQPELCTDGRSLLRDIEKAAKGKSKEGNERDLVRGKGRAAFEQEIGMKSV